MAERTVTYKTAVEPACSLASVANGAGRISAVVDNTTTKATRGRLFVQATLGTSPTANTIVKVYVIAQSAAANNVKAGGGALGDVDAAVSAEPVDAQLVGTMSSTGTTGQTVSESWDLYNVPPKFSVVVWNATGVALGATQPSPVVQWLPFTDTIA